MKTNYIQVGSFKIHYTIEGEGQPIVLVHGLGGSLYNWKETIPFLASQNFQVIALDLPGYGKSSKQNLWVSIPFYAQILRDFLLKIGVSEPPILVGNSMGGHICAYFAAKYKSRLKALVLVDSSGLNEMNFFQELLIHFTFEKNTLANILKYMISIFTFNIFYSSTHPNAKYFIEEQKEMSKRDDFEDYCHALEQSTRAMMDQPLKDLLTEIKAPVLIIWGKNDRLVPVSYGKEFHRHLPNSNFFIIKNCGHVPQLEKPEEFNSLLLDFARDFTLSQKTKPSFWKRIFFFKK